MSLRAMRGAALIAVIALTVTASVAYASSGPTFSVSFSPNKPASSSALTFSLASPQQLTSAAITLPAGTALNLKAVSVCSKPPACDPSTQVGVGRATVQYKTYTIPVSFSMFNTPGGVGIVISITGQPSFLVSSTWSGNTLTIPYPNGMYNGLPIVIRKLSLTFNQLGSGRNAYVRTPSTCPKGGWGSTATLTFGSGPTTSLKASAKCQVAKKAKKKKG